jgi:hypothetical protein
MSGLAAGRLAALAAAAGSGYAAWTLWPADAAAAAMLAGWAAWMAFCFLSWKAMVSKPPLETPRARRYREVHR